MQARREELLEKIGQDITLLWQRLETPDEEQEEFIRSRSGLSDEVIQSCESYLRSKQEEFQARLGDLVAGARTRISELWDEMLFGEKQREEAFAPFFDDECA